MSKILRWKPTNLNSARESASVDDENFREEPLSEEDTGFFSEDEEAPSFPDVPEEAVGNMSDPPGGFLDEGLTTDSEELDELPEGSTDDDASFMSDMADLLTDDQGREFRPDQLLVLQDPATKKVMLYMPEDDDKQVPKGATVIGNVVSPLASELDSSRRLNSGSTHASDSENRIRNLKTTLKQEAVGQVFHDTKIEGKPAIWFSKPLGNRDYVICMLPLEDGKIKVFYSVDDAKSGGPERVEALLRKALSSYPTTYKDVYDFLKSFS